MAVRDFDGVDDVIKLTYPTYWGSGTPHTLVAVIKRDTTSSWDGVLSIGDSLGSVPNVVLEFDDGSIGGVIEYVVSNPVGTDRHSRSPSGFTSTGWELVAASVAADGSTQIRHHHFDGTTWTHANTFSTSGGEPWNGPANWGTTNMELRFGNWNSSFNYFDGKMAVIAMWVGTALSDSQVVALAGGNKAAWTSAGATHLWELNQASTATAVTDSIGSLNQTAITGTTVVTTDDPSTSIYDFGSGTTPATIPLATAAAQTTAALTVTAPAKVTLTTATATTTPTLTLTAGAGVIPLQTAAATTTTTLATRAQTQIPLEAAAGATTGTLRSTAATQTTLQPSTATSTNTLTILIPTAALLTLTTANTNSTANLTMLQMGHRWPAHTSPHWPPTHTSNRWDIDP